MTRKSASIAWPLIRRHGLAHHDAEDALHEFFLKLLRLDSFGAADAEKGRLRTFLLVSLRRFLSNWRRDRFRKNKAEGFCLDTNSMTRRAEARFLVDDWAHQESPDRLFDVQWAQELMRQVLERLRSQYEAKGKVPLFDALQPLLMRGGIPADTRSEEIAAGLGMKAGALRTALHRLKDAFREELERQVLQTTGDRETAKEEFFHLMRVVCPE